MQSNSISNLALGLAVLVLGCGLAACSESSVQTEAVAAPASLSTQAPVAAAAAAPGSLASAGATVAVGSIGGTLTLDERTGAAYSIAMRDGDAWLEGVALLRGDQKGWLKRDIDAAPMPLKHPGIGGSLGRHMVVITPKADALWVDDSLKVALDNGNVALFIGAGVAQQKLALVGKVAIEPYLGPAPLDDPRQQRALVQERLAAILKRSAAIEGLWPAR